MGENYYGVKKKERKMVILYKIVRLCRNDCTKCSVPEVFFILFYIILERYDTDVYRAMTIAEVFNLLNGGEKMKYKVLLMGENKSAIDDFFIQMQDSFDVVTTSSRKEDMVKHLEFFEPNVFVYCINSESVKKDFNKIYLLKSELEKRKVPFILIGAEEECKDFERVAVNTADLILMKPLMASMIEDKICHFLKQKEKEEEEEQKRQEEELRKQEEEQREKERKLEEEQKAKERKHILVIDDDPVMLKMVNAQLHEWYDVATAISGSMALKFLKKKHTDLILLDYEMPVDNGPAVLKKLRENPDTKDIPVVFLTGITERSKIQDVLVLKPQGYLLKPIERDKLFKVISDVLNKE